MKKKQAVFDLLFSLLGVFGAWKRVGFKRVGISTPRLDKPDHEG
jgi:hypothetical protein